jgi:hypothetical protein
MSCSQINLCNKIVVHTNKPTPSLPTSLAKNWSGWKDTHLLLVDINMKKQKTNNNVCKTDCSQSQQKDTNLSQEQSNDLFDLGQKPPHMPILT